MRFICTWKPSVAASIVSAWETSTNEHQTWAAALQWITFPTRNTLLCWCQTVQRCSETFGEYSDTIYLHSLDWKTITRLFKVWHRLGHVPTWQLESHNPRKTRERHTQKSVASVFCGFLTRFHKQGRTVQSSDGRCSQTWRLPTK